jgi:hypothetical protein
VALLLQAAFPPDVQGDPGRGGVRVPLGLPVQRFLVNDVVACGAGGVRGVLEHEEGVNGLPGPGLVQGGADLGDGGQLAQQVRAAGSHTRHHRSNRQTPNSRAPPGPAKGGRPI